MKTRLLSSLLWLNSNATCYHFVIFSFHIRFICTYVLGVFCMNASSPTSAGGVCGKCVHCGLHCSLLCQISAVLGISTGTDPAYGTVGCAGVPIIYIATHLHSWSVSQMARSLLSGGVLFFFSGNREMPQSVPKQKKKAQQYKGQKKSECAWCCGFISTFILPSTSLIQSQVYGPHHRCGSVTSPPTPQQGEQRVNLLQAETHLCLFIHFYIYMYSDHRS